MAFKVFRIKYRDKENTRYSIDVQAITRSANSDNYSVPIIFISENKEYYHFEILIAYSWAIMTYGNNFLEIIGDENYSPFIRNFLMDFLFGKDLSELNGTQIKIPSDIEEKRIFINESGGLLNYDRDIEIIARENIFIRQTVLREAYFVQSKSGSLVMQELHDNVHYDLTCINVAINALKSKGYFFEDKNVLRLSYEGQIFVEEKLLSPFNDKIFLIAACNDYIYELIDKVYRPAVKNFGYQLIFQEKNEPKDTIHEDIWENIENCKMIICDLSYQRPNCFIEYGYAYGKGKKMILCVEENQGKTAEKRLNVPFDTQPQKYSFWQEKWLDEANEDEINKFRKEIEDRLEMKLKILDSQSEI